MAAKYDMKTATMFSIVMIWCCFGVVRCLDNGMGKTPAMGYNTWNAFHENIDEELMVAQAHRLVDLGLRDAGYKYFNLDDAWASPYRDPAGRITADRSRFPSGIQALAVEIHSLGLKFGIYSSAGLKTCLGCCQGSRHHEPSDAAAFAEWGVDYLKYDNCYVEPNDDVVPRFTAMRDALNATGRPMVYAMCEWGVGSPWLWAQSVGNSWRTTADVGNSWEDVLRGLDDSVGLAQFAGPGAFNDPDMLQIGNGRLKLCEERAHFALWAALKSPLLIGADLRTIHPASLDILLSPDIIDINQDPLGIPAELVWKQGPLEVYAGPLAHNARVAVLFNRLNTDSQYPTSNITVLWEQVGVEAGSVCRVRELYHQVDLGQYAKGVRVPVGLRDVVVLKVMCEVGVDADWRPWTAVEMYRRTDLEDVPYIPLKPLATLHNQWKPARRMTATWVHDDMNDDPIQLDQQQHRKSTGVHENE